MGFHFTNGISAAQLHNILQEELMVAAHAGLDVMAICFDGASSNRSWARLTSDLEYRRAYAFCSGACGDPSLLPDALLPRCFPHPAFNHPVFLVPDAPHLVKKLRNSLYASFNPRGAKAVQADGDGEGGGGAGGKRQAERQMRVKVDGHTRDISWQHIIGAAQQDAQSDPPRSRLSPDALELTSYSKMSVPLALAVIDPAVQALLRERFPDGQADGTLLYLDVAQQIYTAASRAYSTNQDSCESLSLLMALGQWLLEWRREREAAAAAAAGVTIDNSAACRDARAAAALELTTKPTFDDAVDFCAAFPAASQVGDAQCTAWNDYSLICEHEILAVLDLHGLPWCTG